MDCQEPPSPFQHCIVGKSGSTYRGLVGRPMGKRLLGTHTCTWEDNIKLNLKKVRWKMWTGLM